MNDYTTSQQCEGEHFAYFSDVSVSKVTIVIQISQSLHFLNIPVRSAAVLDQCVLRFKTMSCFCSPALNAVHGFIHPFSKH